MDKTYIKTQIAMRQSEFSTNFKRHKNPLQTYSVQLSTKTSVTHEEPVSEGKALGCRYGFLSLNLQKIENYGKQEEICNR
ncbi:MAG: hypothetical protein K2J63_11110 [Muribaculaceae bacterium]|nr:hypothetical protein [Muribaculaceae bacterium]